MNPIISVPNNYEDYKKYKKAVKLINRLNNGYIQYDGVEVANYKDIISFDKDKKKYVYTGIFFSDEDLDRCNKYKKYGSLFEKMKKDIMLNVQSIKYDGKVDEEHLDKLADELPFIDDYFKIDISVLKDLNLSEVIEHAMPKFDNFDFSDEEYNNVYNLLVNNGVIWLLIFMAYEYNYDLHDVGLNRYAIADLINDIEDITNFARDFNFNLMNFKELFLARNISIHADSESFAILGKDIVEKLYKNADYTDGNYERIIRMAKRLVCQMVKRCKSTVPYISGKTMNYNYSLYDSQDETILISGINTDACFRVDGADNDFLHYCAIDKNGFVIKITDYYGNFVARASGFRNGNCVFINQLRTVYDEGGFNDSGEYTNEIKEIIETFKEACVDIVKTSKNNIQEIDKIDFVFVTRSYSLDDYKLNVSYEVTDEIGDFPMDNDSEDWKKFVEGTIDLYESRDCDYFRTDYGNYQVICMASSKTEESIKIGDIKPEDIKPKDVPAVYERKRNKIIVTSMPDEIIYQKVNRIAAIDSYFRKTNFTPVKILDDSTVFVGDNWYIIYAEGKVVDFCLLEFDNKAKIEFAATRDAMFEFGLKYQEQLYIDEVTEFLHSDVSKKQVKFLEFK